LDFCSLYSQEQVNNRNVLLHFKSSTEDEKSVRINDDLLHQLQRVNFIIDFMFSHLHSLFNLILKKAPEK
jgi:hypothetical protein